MASWQRAYDGTLKPIPGGYCKVPVVSSAVGTTSASRSVEASTSSILSYLTEFWPINFSREQESVVQSITKNRNCKTAVIYRTARMAQCGDRTRARRYFLASLAARRGVAA